MKKTNIVIISCIGMLLVVPFVFSVTEKKLNEFEPMRYNMKAHGKPNTIQLNGDSYIAATQSTLGPYSLISLPEDATGDPVGSTFTIQSVVPENQPSGSTVRVRIHYFPEISGGGNIKFVFGYRFTAIGAKYSNQPYTHGSEIFAAPTGDKDHEVIEYEFTGVSFTGESSVIFVIGRYSEDATDTYDDTIHISDVEILFRSNQK